jgi:hypothetical protein
VQRSKAMRVPPGASYWGRDFQRFAHRKAVELLPSAPCSLARTVLASARTRLAQRLRICRYMPSISIDYFIARSTSH